MELRHLRYFVTVADESNFTRAAERLHIAQPPLSRQIRQLEEQFGVTLIDREARPLRLTAAGRLFYEQAQLVLAGVAQLQTLMQRHAGSGRRRFVIGFVGSTIYGPMPALIRHFRAAAQHIDVSLLELTTIEQNAALKEGRIDAGIGRIRVEDAGIRRDVLLEEELVAMLPGSHALAGTSAPLSMQELSAETLIIYPRLPRPSYADQVLSLFHDHGLKPAIVHEVRDVQAAVGMVAAEAGVSIVPTSMQRLQREDVIYRRLQEANAVSPILMSWRETDTSPEIVLLRKIAAKLFGRETLMA